MDYNLVCECGAKGIISTWPVTCGCGKKYLTPQETPVVIKDPFPYCSERIEGECNVAMLIAGQPVTPSHEACIGCQKHLSTVNEITIQLAKEANPTLSSPEKGVGSRLANTLSWFIPKPSNCDCADREQIMNLWGPEGCRKNLRTILSWLRESALENNYPYNSYGAKALLLSIIKLSEHLDPCD